MKALVVYDSNFGNTKKIADAIAETIDGKSVSVREISAEMLDKVDLLIAGSPINAWRATEKIREFLNAIPQERLAGVRAAAFDTRVKILISGNAAKKISKALAEKGATIITEPMGFYVQDNEGPLLDGEIIKAKNWADNILQKIKR